MAPHEKFNFKSLEELKEKIEVLNLNINISEGFSPLKKEVKIGDKISKNSIAVLPMEGCDSNRDGSPSELVKRRYHRFAEGGAGLVWWEANAVVEEGRANELQMMLTKDNMPAFKDLVTSINDSAKNLNGYSPVNILQLTHSGRYSRPVGHKAAPIIAQHDPLLDERSGVDENTFVATDEYLDSLVERYVESALLAKAAGFDGVDIKAVHRYLISEILASHTRKGKYGGSFENRTRLLLDIIKEVKRAVNDDSFIVASRFNVFDAHPYPYGFGCDEDDLWAFNPEEPLKLVRNMIDSGVSLLSNSAGNPYYIFPQVTRPFDTSSMGIPTPDEHPLESIERLFEFTRLIQKEAGNIPVIGNGYSWLREFIPYIGSANLSDNSCTMVGLGRMAIAYPDAPKDIFNKGQMDPKKCCIACSRCTQIMRDHGRTGCVIRDSEIYSQLYKEAREDAEARSATK